MRTLFWCDAFWPAIGGIPVLAAGLVRALSERGHELHVVADEAPTRSPRWQVDFEVPIARLPFMATLRSRSALRTAALIREVSELKAALRPDLVLVFALSPNVLFHLQTRRAWPSPSIVTLHGSLPYLTESSQTLVGQTLRAADWVMTCSRSCLEETVRRYPWFAEKASVARNAVEPLSGLPLPLEFDPPRLLVLGRLSPEKGVDVAVSAFRTVARLAHGSRLVIAGEGPQRRELEQQVRRSALGERVDFVGAVTPDEARRLISESSIVLIPSRSEGFSLVALEAALLGRPVVASQVGGIPEVVVDGLTGLLVPPDAPDELANAVLRLTGDPAGARVIAADARRRAGETFSWTRFVDAYDDRIRTLGRG